MWGKAQTQSGGTCTREQGDKRWRDETKIRRCCNNVRVFGISVRVMLALMQSMHCFSSQLVIFEFVIPVYVFKSFFK